MRIRTWECKNAWAKYKAAQLLLRTEYEPGRVAMLRSIEAESKEIYDMSIREVCRLRRVDMYGGDGKRKPKKKKDAPVL